VPALVFWLTKRICIELAAERAHPLRSWDGDVVTRNERGGFDSR
jgi:hypothetical protein